MQTLTILLLSFFFGCKAEEQKRRKIIYGNSEIEIRKITVGVQRLSFSLSVNMGGFQNIESKEIIYQNSSEAGFNGGVWKGENFQAVISEHDFFVKITISTFNLAFDYMKDELPFIKIEFSCGDGERYFGFGEWSDYADATRLKREIWVSEQHAGRGEDKGKEDVFPFGKVLTYFPVPFFVSSHNYAFFVSGYARMEFDMCSESDTWSVKIFSDNAETYIFTWDGKPLEAIEKFTRLVGRQKTPPIWAFGNWIDAIFGSENVRKTAQWLREKKIPASVIWTEDWAGGRWVGEDIYTIGGWDLKPSEELYPDIKELSEDLRKLGFRFLGYFHSFVTKEDEEVFSTALSEGLLLKDKDGQVKITFLPPEGETALLDLMNPSAWKFMKYAMMKAYLLGFSGWMADFGEWVTPDMVSADGKTGWEFHNLYPYLWAKLNREFWEEVRPDGDFVFFSRSGFTGSWTFSPVVWQGDQNTSFERFDGLGSIIPSVTSIGFSGVANVGPDIAGYTAGLFTPPSDKELYIRWTALCAFLPVFRTHHGTTPLKNWRFDRDEETTEIFRRYAVEHMRIVPFIYKLSKLAEEKGYPIVRHIFLEFPHVVRFLPEKKEVIEQEFLLGDTILVAPIVERGKTKREVFIPPGEWVDYFSGEIWNGGQNGVFVEVEIPLSEIFVAVKKGKCIDVFDPPPHSLVPFSDDVRERYGLVSPEEAKIVKKCF